MPVMSHPWKVKRGIRDSGYRRIAQVITGDSNVNFGGAGWKRAMRKALDKWFRFYASTCDAWMGGCGDNSMGAPFASPFGGMLWSDASNGWDTTGAPAYFDQLIKPTVSSCPQRYAYKGAGVSYTPAPGNTQWYSASTTSPVWRLNTPLRWHFSYGRSPAWNGSFRPAVHSYFTTFLGQSPAPISTNFPLESVAWDAVDFSSSLADQEFRLHPRHLYDGIDVTGELCLFYQCLENLAVAAGTSLHSPYAVGGQAVRYRARVLGCPGGGDAIVSMPADQMFHYLDAMTRGLGPNPAEHIATVWEYSIFNDANPANSINSIGPHPAASNTAAGFYDNHEAMYLQWLDLWALSGRDPDNFFYVLAPGHPLTDPDPQGMREMRLAAKDFAASHANCSDFDFTRIVTRAEIDARGWDAGGEHLNSASSGDPDANTNAYDAIFARGFDLAMREMGRPGRRPATGSFN